jgi:transcriptional regulator of acetoin/glycerol metabolism
MRMVRGRITAAEREARRRFWCQLLEDTRANVYQMARRAAVPRFTVYRALRRYGLALPPRRQHRGNWHGL